MAVERSGVASAGQRLIWLLERYGGDGGALHVCGAYRLRGVVEVGALVAAAGAVVDRHEGLRSTFARSGHELTQFVHAAADRPDDVVRVVDVAAGDLAGAVEEEYRRRFDLAAQWPVRFRLFRLSEAESVLVLYVHHIVTDGWSMAVIADDLKSFYDLRTGRSEEVAEAPVWHPIDVAEWQRRRIEDGALAVKTARWREVLGVGQPVSVPAVLEDPAPAGSGERGVLRYEMPASFAGVLREIARQERSTFFAVLLGAFAGYLGRCAGEDRVLLPAVFADRSNRRVRRTVGFLINLLLVPIEVADRDFGELVRHARTVVFDAIANQEVPYHTVPMPPGVRGGRQQPEVLFEYGSIDVEYMNVPGRTVQLSGVEVEPYEEVAFTATPFAVEFHFGDVADGLHVKCLYRIERTSAAALTRFLDGFVAYVGAAASDYTVAS
ncbi:condensation domain-containing protein [Nocardia sp. bgisy134]|uniref:condensation domain-containing protein n=1 Tax=Nocardia sp. bgisy134 TaxID=3413789 RepID=UPI003D71D506